jgi:hypothetical protein
MSGKPTRGSSPQPEETELNVRFGSKADICAATTHVRFTPIATKKADIGKP